MNTEINNRGLIRSGFSSFPSGNDTECLTKQDLLNGSGNLMNVGGGDTECVPMDAIGFKAYPCKSQTDKAPLREIPIVEEEGVISKIWLSRSVDSVLVRGMSYPSGFENWSSNPFDINTPLILSGIYTKISLKNEYIEILGALSAINSWIKLEIDGVVYTVNNNKKN